MHAALCCLKPVILDGKPKQQSCHCKDDEFTEPSCHNKTGPVRINFNTKSEDTPSDSG